MNRIIKIILHLFYWMVFLLFSGIVSFRLAGGFDFILQNISTFVFNLVWAAIQFYLFYFFVYRLIEQQRYILYFVFSVIAAIGLSALMIMLFIPLFQLPFIPLWKEIIPPIIGTFIIGHTGSLLRGFISWFH